MRSTGAPPRTSLTFLGAARTVTGSRFLVEHDGLRVLVDCGLYQGLRELRRRNWEPFPLPPAELDAVVLTHAHLDHCGYLPRLVREGFSGPVLCTPGTAELVAVVLRDSARLQEEDARAAREGGWSKHARPEPLYDSQAVEATLPLLAPRSFGGPEAVLDGSDVTVTFRPSGHILGGAVVELRLGGGDGGAGTGVVFTGDLGRDNHPLLAPPVPPPACDVVVTESTYGDRTHPAPTGALVDAVRRTVGRGGVVVVPAFAVDRTEIVLLDLAAAVRSGAIPPVPVYVDSPMALATLRLYRSAMAERSPELRGQLPGDGDPFDAGTLVEVPDPERSRQLNEPGEPCVLVSASGMAAGGRVVHHLASLLPDPRNTVALVGYQAVGTRGRDLLAGARQLKMLGRYVPVRAEVVDCPQYSVHADAGELLSWLGRVPVPAGGRSPAVFVVHGEETAALALADRVDRELGWLAVAPRDGERVLVSP